jgi:hypothetical protein
MWPITKWSMHKASLMTSLLQGVGYVLFIGIATQNRGNFRFIITVAPTFHFLPFHRCTCQQPSRDIGGVYGTERGKCRQVTLRLLQHRTDNGQLLQNVVGVAYKSGVLGRCCDRFRCRRFVGGSSSSPYMHLLSRTYFESKSSRPATIQSTIQDASNT